MGQEIERKFLVRNENWRAAVEASEEIRQGYLCRTTRVRRIADRAFLTIKGEGDLVRTEFEYAIPTQDADLILTDLCAGLIEKTRHTLRHAGMIWTVDEFHGRHAGLLLAEVELARADQTVTPPEWAGAEVTGDRRYRNAVLAGL